MSHPSIDTAIQAEMTAQHLPGVATAVVKEGQLVWSQGYGVADIASQRSMHADTTLQNIGSISKTITAAAVMQLWERGQVQLDADINAYLPFAVRNPAFPDVPITLQQLLTHRSSIKDGDAYVGSYTLGDPTESLTEWITAYFTPDGPYWNEDENWHTWQPGEQGELPKEPRNYSNVAFGLLGYLVACVSGLSFRAYCCKHLLAPLGMERSGWLLADVDTTQHATLYAIESDDDEEQEEIALYAQMGFIRPKITHPQTNHSLYPINPYGFANYPDGLLRTSATQLAHFLAAMINQGSYAGAQILQPATVQKMLTVHNPNAPRQGLCWNTATSSSTGETYWWHDGGDPGTSTLMMFQPDKQTGAIALINASDANPLPIVMHLLKNIDCF